MLDLTNIRSFYELKWFDGRVLHIRKPSQRLLEKMLSLENLNHEEQLVCYWELIRDILNSNTDNIIFSNEELEKELDIELSQVIIEDYLNTVLKKLGE